MKKAILITLASLGLLTVSAGAGAVPAYFNDFDGGESFAAGVAGGFGGAGAVEGVQDYGTNVTTSAAGFAGSFFRNTATGNPAASTTLTLTGLGAHTSIDIDFLLAIIDSWDGSATSVAPDFFNVRVDGVIVYSETYDQFDLGDQSASTSNLIVGPGVPLGFSGSWGESAYDMTGVAALTGIAHTNSSLTIEFFASGGGWQGGTDESFALENVAVQLNAAGVPEPGTLALLGLGLAGLGRLRRRAGAC